MSIIKPIFNDYFSKNEKIVEIGFTFCTIFAIILSKNVEKRGKGMQACRITITTAADGRETQFVRAGSMRLFPFPCEIIYREENAEVRITLEKGVATVQRTGEYTLSFLLKEGERSEGTLGIAGAVGSVQAVTHKLAFSVQKDSLLLSMHYDLLFGEEKQEIKLRLYAKAE